jgi:protein-tyrosine phosphatase
VIDLHCHALPGIDDGPADLGAAVALARAAAELGMRTLVATPHIDHWWNVDPASLPERVATLQAALDAAGVAIEVRTGGEIALPRLPELTEQELDGLSLGGGRHVLLEAPLTPDAGDFEARVLETLERRPVLLAHPERCPAFLRTPERYERLLEAGVLGQVTAGSFTGQWCGTIRTTAARWLDRGWVH